eukprot:s436_g9.t1
MLCKGTAWNQVRSIPAEKLTSAETGVTSLLEALASWEETEEMVTFEKFERALYKVLQKSDESTMSFTNRLNVAFSDLGDNVKLADFKAFILLRQSSLSNEDKRKILTMTGGKMEVKAIEQSMRSLATRILTGQNEPKKKVYPTNYIEEESSDLQDSLEPAWHAASTGYDEDIDDSDLVEQLASQGDSDALVIQSFEQDLEDLFQSTPDLQSALVSYQEARVKLSERKKFRGLRPSSAKGFHAKGKGKNKKGFMKGGSKSSLLERISKTNCKLCGERGHWRAECPNKNREAAANVVTSSSAVDVPDVEAQHVIVEAFDDVTSLNWSSFASVETCMFASNVRDNRVKTNGVRHNGVSWKEQAILFLSNRLSQRRTSALDDRNSKVLTDVRSEMHCAMSTTTDGSHAVLDTGASRSVIGAELVPALLKDLPSTVRDSVKQVPSKIGFRFGNNQVSYSHAQLQIPMRDRSQTVCHLTAMPSQADMIQTIKAISEQVMESLKALLFLLVSLAEIHNNAQPVSEERSSQMLQLLSEVRLQTSKIDEISTMLKSSPSPRRQASMAVPVVDSDQEWEVASQVTSIAPSVTPSRPASRAARAQPAMPVQTSPSAPTAPVMSNAVNETQIVQAVNPNIETWGQKCISWGRKWPGVRYQEVYERDQGYVQWIADRSQSPTPPMRDFYLYCQNRQRLEHHG